MTLFKVIGNYYTDLLDYLSLQYRKYGGNFDRYFNEMTDDAKKELLDKIGYLFQRVEMIKMAEQKLWESKKRNNLIFIIILACIMFAVLAILAALCIFTLKTGDVVRFTEKLKTMLMYFISYLIAFTILLLLIINIDENRKKAGRMMTETVDDVENLKKLFDVETRVRMVLMFIAYKNSENKLVYERMLKTSGAALKPYTIDLTRTAAEATNNPTTTVAPSFDINYQYAFQDLKVPLLAAIKKFYADGAGYTNLRKELISSSNILILAEMRRIMQYYYSIGQRKMNSTLAASSETNQTPATDIIDRFVIPELKTYDKAMQPPNPNAYADPLAVNRVDERPQDVIHKNETNRDFMNEFYRVPMAFFFITIYVYQLYIQKLKDDPTFPADIKLLMPNDVDVSTDVEFLSMVKRTFEDHYKTQMTQLLGAAKTAGNINSVLTSVAISFKPIVDHAYSRALIHLQGDYLFPFNTTYMEGKIRDLIAGNKLPDEYVNMMVDFYLKTFIPRSFESYKTNTDVEQKKATMVTTVSLQLTGYDIQLSQNSKYIIDKLKSVQEVSSTMETNILRMLTQIDQSVAAKKRASASTDTVSVNTTRFLTLTEFTKLIDEVPYEDLRTGLNAAFFREILDKFYFSVSNAIYTNSKSSKDIYFNDEKKFKLAKIALIMTVVVIIFGLIYATINIAGDMSLLSRAMLNNSRLTSGNMREKKIAYEEYGEEYANNYIKLILPWVACFFFICLLFSFYRKGLAKYRFNKDTIDSNTSQLRSALLALNNQLMEMDDRVGKQNWYKQIKSLTVWTTDEKTRLHKSIITIIDKAEKCNYILSMQKMEIPFPYTEAILDMFMISVVLICMVYMIGRIDPMERAREIKYLNKLKERGLYEDTSRAFAEEVASKAKCHDSDIDNIIFTIKVLFFLFIIMFLIFYATKVITSTSEFEFGLYTSKYFEESRCYE